ncbi:MAG: hypothetical protein ACI4XM_00450 [Candidatus Coprovivens sp.]
MLDEKIISIEKDGTKNYYHITGAQELLILKLLINNIDLYLKERKKLKVYLDLFGVVCRFI